VSFTAEFETTLEALQAYAARAKTRDGRVITQPAISGLVDSLGVEELIAKGGLRGKRFQRFLEAYLSAATRLHHPGAMSHQVAVPEPMGALGALIDSFTNNSASIYEMGPSAGALEFGLLNWMLAKAGWKPSPAPGGNTGGNSHGAGILTHGGSLANLTALMAARARVAPEAWRDGLPRDFVLLAPETSHYSIGRAVDILGLGRNALRPAPVDDNGRIVPGRLAEAIAGLKRDGSRVLAVVANACATAAGLFDPLRETAHVCAEAGVWLHVDGAHGASALLSQRHRRLLDGVEQADSLVWDAHKMLRTPSNCTAVLVPDHRWLDSAFHQEASYLFHDKDQPGIDFIHRSVECTKAGLGLKLFMALAAEGESGAATFVDRQVELAQSAARFISSRPGLELAVAPEFNILCFRTHGSDEEQLEIRRRILERGEYFISTTEFRGSRWLRLSLMNPETGMEDIVSLMNEVEESAARMAGEGTTVPARK
jgi:L-2,4-diaminobutyrate decarboxylase